MKDSFFCIVLAFVFALYINAPMMAAQADFSGTWKLDTVKSSGLPPGMEQTMFVTQKGDAVKIETRVKSPNGEQTVPDNYVLDGKETDFKLPNAPDAKGKRTSKWNAGGNGFDVSEKAVVETPDGEATIEATRKWTLAADGKTLTIEMTVKSPNGTQESKRTFVKQ